MRYIKKFEALNKEDRQKKEKEQIDLLRDLLMENPDYDTHDFYLFIGRDTFREDKDGRYTKTLEIEKMVKITPDSSSLGAMNGMKMRAMAQQDSTLYHIWLPKEIEDEVAWKGSNEIEPWLVELINKHKMKGADSHGRQVYKDVLQRKNDMDKYNL